MFRFKQRIPHYLILEDNSQKPRHSSWLKAILKLFFAAFVFCLLALLLAGWAGADTTYQPANSEAGKIQSLSETSRGELLFIDEEGYQTAPHQKTDVKVNITGLIATTRYRQTFKNDSNSWQTAIYVFPLAESAAVREMEIHIGERVIRSQIKEKQQAKALFKQAQREGKVAALTEQDRANLFKQRLANIAPYSEIEVELIYSQPLVYRDGEFSLHLPTTITPRYIPDGERAGTRNVPDDLGQLYETHRKPALTKASLSNRSNAAVIWQHSEPVLQPLLKSSSSLPPGSNQMSIHIELDLGLTLADISSRFHDIKHQFLGGKYQIKLRAGQAVMDRDFWLDFKPVHSQTPQAASFVEHHEGSDYGLLFVLPPYMEDADQQRLAREVIFIIDTSGSMQGTSIIQAKQSLILALDRLTAEDNFNIIEFNSSHKAFYPSAQPATEINIKNAKRFINHMRATGGTNMSPALSAALNTQEADGLASDKKLRQVVFITDGAVGNEAGLLAQIHQQLGDSRLFTVGIGSAPNSFFMTRAAEFGRGSFEFIGSANEVSARMQRLFRKLESPLASQFSLQWPAADVSQFPKRIPDLYQGEPIMVIAKADTLTGPVQVSGQLNDQIWQQTVQLNRLTRQEATTPDDIERTTSDLSSLWGRAKIKSLMDEKYQGRAESEVREDVLAVALEHHLVSAYTSLIAVEQVPSRPAGESADFKQVANLKPRGQTHWFPQTATWMPLHVLLALLSMIGLGINALIQRAGAGGKGICALVGVQR